MPPEDPGPAEPAIALDPAEEQALAEVGKIIEMYLTGAIIALRRADDPPELHELYDALLDLVFGKAEERREQEPAPSGLGPEGATSVLTASHE